MPRASAAGHGDAISAQKLAGDFENLETAAPVAGGVRWFVGWLNGRVGHNAQLFNNFTPYNGKRFCHHDGWQKRLLVKPP